MKILSNVARYLLGIMFVIFGLNGFLHFLPQAMPAGQLAQQYLTVLVASHYLVLVFIVQLLAGVLFLVGRVPLALTLIAPVLVNILQYHFLMDPAGVAPGLVATLLWVVLFVRYRENFAGLFR